MLNYSQKTLEYSRSAKSKVLGCVDLTKVAGLRKVRQDENKHKKFAYGFELIVPGRVYSLQAPLSASIDAWMKEIQYALHVPTPASPYIGTHDLLKISGNDWKEQLHAINTENTSLLESNQSEHSDWNSFQFDSDNSFLADSSSGEEEEGEQKSKENEFAPQSIMFRHHRKKGIIVKLQKFVEEFCPGVDFSDVCKYVVWGEKIVTEILSRPLFSHRAIKESMRFYTTLGFGVERMRLEQQEAEEEDSEDSSSQSEDEFDTPPQRPPPKALTGSSALYNALGLGAATILGNNDDTSDDDVITAWLEEQQLAVDNQSQLKDVKRKIFQVSNDECDFDPKRSCKTNAVALMWVIIVKLASYDELFTSGVIRMDDPGARIFAYLAECRGLYERHSTHFQECIESTKQLQGGKLQLGLDVRGLGLPARQNAILFSRLPDNTIFIKLERFGCPPFWEKDKRNIANLKEYVGHSKAFLYTRWWSDAKGMAVTRKEHTSKEDFKNYSAAILEFYGYDQTEAKESLKKGKLGLSSMIYELNQKLELSAQSALTETNENILIRHRKNCQCLSDAIQLLMQDITQDSAKGYQGTRKGKEATLPGFDLWTEFNT